MQTERLTVENTNLIFSGINVVFRDPRKFSQGSEAIVDLTNARIDASKALSFSSVVTLGRQFTTQILSSGGLNEFIFPKTPDKILGSGGIVEVDINNGSTFRILDSGENVNKFFDINASVNVGTFVDSSWNFHVGRDGNGGTLDIVNSFVNLPISSNQQFTNSINLYNNANYNIATDSSVVKLNQLNVIGDNATHRVRIGSGTIDHANIQGNNMTFDVRGAGNIHFGDVQLAKGVSTLNFIGNPQLGAKNSVYRVAIASKGGNDVNNIQQVNLIDVARGDFSFGSEGEFFNINLQNSKINATATLVGKNQNALLDANSRIDLSGAPITVADTDTLTIKLTDPTNTNSVPVVTLAGKQLLGNVGITFESESNRPWRLEVGALDGAGIGTHVLYTGAGNTVLTGGTQLVINPFATLAIGDDCETNLFKLGVNKTCAVSTAEIGSLTVNGSTLFDFSSRLQVDIGKGINNGPLASDTLFYDADQNSFSRMEVLVKALNVSSANELDQQEFTILAPKSSGFKANISKGIQITKAGNMPAALALTINPTEADAGNLVLSAQKDLDLLKSPTQSRNHRQLTSALVNQAKATPNKPIAIQVIDSSSNGQLTTTQTTLDALASSISVDGINALGQAHAEGYSSYLTVQLEQTDLLSKMVMNHAIGQGQTANYSAQLTAQTRLTAPIQVAANQISDLSLWGNDETVERGLMRGWVDSALIRGRVKGSNDLGSFKYSANQVVGGYDLHQNQHGTFVFFVAAGNSKMSEHDVLNQRVHSDLAGLGVYSHHVFSNDIRISSTVGYARAKNRSERQAQNIGNLAGGTAKAKFTSNNFYAGARVHKSFAISAHSDWKWMPSFGVDYSMSRSAAFTDQGANNFNFSVDSATSDALVFTPGIDLFKHIHLANGQALYLDGNKTVGLSYQYTVRENGEEHGLRCNFTWYF